MRTGIIQLLSIGCVALIPLALFAASAPTTPTDFKGFVGLMVGLIKTIVMLVFVLAFLAFLWGITKGWILHGDSTEGVQSGKDVLVAGVVGFVVLVAVWGIVSLLKSSFFGS